MTQTGHRVARAIRSSLSRAGCRQCGVSVVLGAFAAHGLKSRLDPAALGVFQTGVNYQFLHSLALCVLALWLLKLDRVVTVADPAAVAGIAFIVGIFFFSGSLYGLSLGGAALARTGDAARRIGVHCRLDRVCVERMAQLIPSRVYIRRQGRMTRAQARAVGDAARSLSVSSAARIVMDNPLRPRSTVGRRSGFRNGSCVLATAQRYPDWNCVGIEVYRPGIGALLNAIDAAGLANVRIIEGDARHALANLFGTNSLHRVMVFFPDPWPKSKHHKRRLINAEFAALVANRLAPDGQLQLATDWEHYAMAMRAVLDAEPG